MKAHDAQGRAQLEAARFSPVLPPATDPTRWRVRAARRLPAVPHRVLRGHKKWVTNLVAVTAPDGRELLVSSSDDHTVRIWDPSTNTQLARLKGHEANILGLCLVDDRIVTGSDDATLRVWDPVTGEQVGNPTQVDVDAVRQVISWRHDGRAFVSALCYGRKGHDLILTWDATTWEQIGTPIREKKRDLTDLTFLQVEGQPLLSALAADFHKDRSFIQFWDPFTGEKHGNVVKLPHDSCRALTVLPDGLLAVVHDDRRVLLVDPATRERVGKPFKHKGGEVSTLTWFDDDGATRLVTVVSNNVVCADDPAIRIWDLASGKVLHQFPTGHVGRVDRLVVFNEGRSLAAASTDGTIRIWDLAEARDHRPEDFTGCEGYPGLVQHLPTGSGAGLLATLNGVWDASTGALVHAFEGDIDDHAVHVGPDGTATLLRLDEEGQVTVWDPTQAAVTHSFHTDEQYSCLDPEPGGTRLACRGLGPTVDLRDSATGEKLDSLTLTEEGYDDVEHVVWLPGEDGARIGMIFYRSFIIWNPATGERSTHPVPGDGFFDEAVVLPGGRLAFIRLAEHFTFTGLRIADADLTPSEPQLAGSKDQTEAVPLAGPAGSDWLATCGNGSIIRVWDLATGEQLFKADLGVRLVSLAALPDRALAVGFEDGWAIIELPERFRLS
ncbi:WD40 repeat domain-containing protein [Arachnia propionica]|nr:WD40 repeat domain-containing protein [Arachnia propionica]